MDEVLKQIVALRSDLKEEFKSGLTAVETRLGSTQASIDANTNSLLCINTWRSGVDAQVSDLMASLEAIRKQVDHVVVGVGLSALGTPLGTFSPPQPDVPPSLGASPREPSSGQVGHGGHYKHRGQTEGTLGFPLSTPVAGTNSLPHHLALVTVPENQRVDHY
ncbi:hypothetical protein QYE76_005334 [Lolium multiflorum]|uniref:Uncharacterized protein n=1 Tax=Lolium multiflorum TaxID=4521 RepID=A0AAD8RUI6_LOLMU|nr:hypothetical protein QYE76_005334 [Lolium multiflorum]